MLKFPRYTPAHVPRNSRRHPPRAQRNRGGCPPRTIACRQRWGVAAGDPRNDSPDKGTAEIIIRKQRNGPIGSVRLSFLGQYTRFENLAHDDYGGQFE